MKNKILKQLQTQKIKSISGWRIYFDGELLVMNSGKYVWGKEGHAKNALIHSLKDTIPEWRGFYQEEDNLHNSLNELINIGTIQIRYEE